MEVCPYCRKPFKRLKSHLPHCKKIEPASGEDQKALPSKPALLASAKKAKRLTQGGTEPGTGAGGKPTKVTRDTREGPIQPFPVRDVGVGGAGTPGAGGDFWSQIQVSLQAPGVAEPKTALQGGGGPKAKPVKTPKPQRWGREPAKLEAALPRGPALSVPEKTSSSALAEKIRAISARVSVDQRDPPGQKLRGQASRIPRGGSRHSPTSLGHGGPSITDLSSNARASDGLSHVPLGVACPEARAQAPQPPSLLHMSPRHEKQGQDAPGPGLPLGGRAQGDTGKARDRVAVAGTVVRASANGHPKKDLPVSTAPRLRAGSQAPSPSLVALAVKCLPAEKAEARPPQGVPELLISPLRQQFVSGQPTLGAWPQAKVLPGGQLAQQTSPATRGLPAATDPKPSPGLLGLQWLPELYPAYLGLSVFPGKLQYWDIVAPKLQLATPQGESHTQVPLWGRSWTRLRSLEPTSLAPSNLSLESLLAAVQRGWLKCGACMRSGVGSVTMLFTGYFVLCCNWSFKHLKLQRWRK